MLRQQERNKRILKSKAFEYMWKVDRTLQKDFQKKFYGQLPWEDQLRLLTLKMWERKYHVSLHFILSTLIPFWKAMMESKRRRTNEQSLGIRIATLTGKVSEKILQKEIQKHYPNGENVTEWRATEQETYAKIQRTVLSKYRDISKFMKEYTRSCKKVRRRSNRMVASGKFKRRHYANNPWV